MAVNNKGYDKYTESRTLPEKIVDVIKKRGVWKFFSYTLEYIYHNIEPRKSFVFKGKRFKVYRSLKNPLTPWRGEREAELPIFKDYIDNYKSKAILEVGNVLMHYYATNHDVVDKYEVDKGVINEDVIDFKPNKKYDLIVSISTIEHIGWDEAPRKPKNVELAIDNLVKLLNKGGTFVYSFSWGANQYLEEQIIKGKIKFSSRYLLRKVRGVWKEVSFDDFIKSKESPKMNTTFFIGVVTR